MSVIVCGLALGAWAWGRLGAPPVVTLRGHSDWVTSIAFRSDGRVLASASHDSTIKLWDPESGRYLRSLTGPGRLESLAFSPDGRLLAASAGSSGMGDHPVVVWDVASDRVVQRLSAQATWMGSPSFSPDSRLVTALVRGPDDVAATVVWDVTSGDVVRSLPGRAGAVSFSPDGRLLTSSERNAVNLLDASSGALVRSWSESHYVASVVLSHDSQLMAVTTVNPGTSEYDSEIQLWEVASGRAVRTIQDPGQVLAVAFSPNDRLLASGCQDHAVRVWNVATGELVKTLSAHTMPVLCVAFGPDGRTVASGSSDGTLVLWTLAR